MKGVSVKFCGDTACSIGTTGENGVAIFNMPEGVVYKIHVLKMPGGYEMNSDEYRALNASSDLAVVVNRAV